MQPDQARSAASGRGSDAEKSRAVKERLYSRHPGSGGQMPGPKRPDRRSREILRKRGLIDHFYEQGRGSHWRITAKGKEALDAAS